MHNQILPYATTKNHTQQLLSRLEVIVNNFA